MTIAHEAASMGGSCSTCLFVPFSFISWESENPTAWFHLSASCPPFFLCVCVCVPHRASNRSRTWNLMRWLQKKPRASLCHPAPPHPSPLLPPLLGMIPGVSVPPQQRQPPQRQHLHHCLTFSSCQIPLPPAVLLAACQPSPVHLHLGLVLSSLVWFSPVPVWLSEFLDSRSVLLFFLSPFIFLTLRSLLLNWISLSACVKYAKQNKDVIWKID